MKIQVLTCKRKKKKKKKVIKGIGVPRWISRGHGIMFFFLSIPRRFVTLYFVQRWEDQKLGIGGRLLKSGISFTSLGRETSHVFGSEHVGEEIVNLRYNQIFKKTIDSSIISSVTNQATTLSRPIGLFYRMHLTIRPNSHRNPPESNQSPSQITRFISRGLSRPDSIDDSLLDRMRAGTHNLGKLLSILEDYEGRHGSDTELLGYIWDFVDVDLDKVGLGVLFREAI
ncbi:hypothetical protein EYC80_001696 [Monilinia laxa]|uniref:Uncharacterized protein n=1 Tax=Monilinia laxa TaxID=61186 RepID=A0A5N6K5S2_MONLA|nr:hypothetical protein EYC80_001696 [Monilinia laxa]